MSGKPKPIVYVIDTDAAVRDSIRVLLACESIEVCAYTSGSAFLDEQHLAEQNCCILVDENLPGLNGLDVLDALYQRGVVIPAIVTTSRNVTNSLRSVVDRAGCTLLEKPFVPGELIAKLRRALDRG